MTKPVDIKLSVLLKEQAYQAIHAAILNETFAAGEFLSERKLIEYLGMSKTPIKSALDRLEAEGFVKVFSKQGIIVQELSYEKVRDILELRIVLEGYVCDRIAGRLTTQQTELLDQNLDLQRLAYEVGDEAAFTKADADFHILLSRFSGNGEIGTIMAMYQAQLYRAALRVIRRVPDRMQAACKDHRDIYQALREGDSARAGMLMKEHLVFAQDTLRS